MVLSFSKRFLLFLLVHLGFVVFSSTTDSIEAMVEKSKNKPKNNLTCHVCHSERQPDCFNLTDSWDTGFETPCDHDKPICLVRKFAFTMSNATSSAGEPKTFAIRRNCTDRCESGCVVMGERTRIYVCNTCCNTNNCNTGNGAEASPRIFPLIAYLLLALIAGN